MGKPLESLKYDLREVLKTAVNNGKSRDFCCRKSDSRQRPHFLSECQIVSRYLKRCLRQIGQVYHPLLATERRKNRVLRSRSFSKRQDLNGTRKVVAKTSFHLNLMKVISRRFLFINHNPLRWSKPKQTQVADTRDGYSRDV